MWLKLWHGEENMHKVFFLWGIGSAILSTILINFSYPNISLVPFYCLFPIFGGYLVWKNSHSNKGSIRSIILFLETIIVLYFSSLFLFTIMNMTSFAKENVAPQATSLFHKGFEYTYETIPANNPSADIVYYGKMSVINPAGQEIYSNSSQYMPGCAKNIPAISLLETSPKEEWVMFCGNTGGRHNTVHIFKPYQGIVAYLDFQDGPVNLKPDSQGVYNAIVHYKHREKGESGWTYYSKHYQLQKVEGALTFIPTETCYVPPRCH